MIRNRFTGKALALPAGILLGVAVLGVPAQAQATGQWQFTGSLATGHSNTHLAQLPDGRVLAISGSGAPGVLTSTAEIYDPGTGRWAPAGTLNNARVAFGQPSVLADGDVLVAGGHDVNVVDYATAELYDPATNQWTFTGSLNTARRYDVQVELANGEVLAATGSSGPPTCTRYLSSAELYNPATGQWTYTGSALIPREGASAIRLADGRVLLAGGYNGGSACSDTDPADTEIYDPSTGQWSFAGNLPHGWLNGAMVLLPDHRVLLVDGWQYGSGNFAEAVIFDPATNQWSEAAAPSLPRSGAAATLLPDGKVLLSQGGQLQSEIYDPVANTWSLDATALDANNGGHTFLLPNGKVLVVGGSNSTGPSTTAELYTAADVVTPNPNYAGLAAVPADTAKGFSHVDATWQEPQLTCNGPVLPGDNPRTPTVSIWTGLGGVKANAQLVQIGTVDSCALGKIEIHLPFFQVFPLDQSPTLIPRLVLHGDKITARIDYDANTKIYTAILKDTNTRPGPLGSWTYTIKRSDAVLADPLTRSTAEWIAERPVSHISGCANSALRPLADFHSVTIAGSTAAAASQFNAYKIAGTSSETAAVLAEPASSSTTATTGTASVDVVWRALGCNL